MKKFLTLAFAAIAAMTNAQYRMNNYNGNEGQNDVKINMLSLFFYGTEFGYERILNPNVGIGGSVMIPYGDNTRLVIKSNLNSYVSPYIRYYFNGFGPASGFFVEGFGLLSDGKYTPRDENGISADTKKDYSAFGAGFGIGEKWTSRSGIFLEATAGFGRNFSIPEDAATSLILIGKVGVSVGYRF